MQIFHNCSSTIFINIRDWVNGLFLWVSTSTIFLKGELAPPLETLITFQIQFSPREMSLQICHNCLKKHKPTHSCLTLNVAARRHSINKIKDREILMLSVSPQGNTQRVLVLVPSHIHFSSPTTSTVGKIFATSSPLLDFFS